jgi:hypothetical protein
MRRVGSENARVGFAEGMRVLRAGGRALDAVEAAVRTMRGFREPADDAGRLDESPSAFECPRARPTGLARLDLRRPLPAGRAPR